MDDFMEKHKAYTLRIRMDNVYDLYRDAVFRGDLVLESSLGYKSLTVRSYRLKGTFWRSSGIFFAEALVAIITENGIIYDYLNRFCHWLEINPAIQSDLNDFISAIDKQGCQHTIYPVKQSDMHDL